MTILIIILVFFFGFIIGAARERVLNAPKAEIDHLNGFIRQFKEELSEKDFTVSTFLEYLKLNKYKILKK